MSDRDATVLMIGETLLVLQKFGRFLAAVLMTTVTPADVDAKLRMALLRDKETLGRLMSYFAVRTELPDRFAETFVFYSSGGMCSSIASSCNHGLT
jgi:hypothetical protein